MFDWIGDLIDAIAEAIREAFEFLGTQISNTIWNTMLRWFYETIYDAVADFFTMTRPSLVALYGMAHGFIELHKPYTCVRTSLMAQTVKRLSTMQEIWVQSLCWEDPLKKEMAIHSSTIAWKIP